MPKLAEQDPKKIYYFTSRSGRGMKKYSGNSVSESEIREYEIPAHLLEQQQPKNKDCNIQKLLRL